MMAEGKAIVWLENSRAPNLFSPLTSKTVANRMASPRKRDKRGSMETKHPERN
jgi:hypothetical protein